MDAAKFKKSVEFINNPAKWPCWPVLPMKADDWQIGCVTADYPTILMRFAPTMKGILLQIACEDENGLPILGHPTGAGQKASDEMRAVYEANIIRRFEDVEAMFDAGWEID